MSKPNAGAARAKVATSLRSLAAARSRTVRRGSRQRFELSHVHLGHSGHYRERHVEGHPLAETVDLARRLQ